PNCPYFYISSLSLHDALPICIINFRPVYYPFAAAIKDNKRTEVNVPLLKEDDHYTIDFDKFEEAAAEPNNKILLFCSPHNPVGRVWTKEELEKVANIA